MMCWTHEAKGLLRFHGSFEFLLIRDPYSLIYFFLPLFVRLSVSHLHLEIFFVSIEFMSVPFIFKRFF